MRRHGHLLPRCLLPEAAIRRPARCASPQRSRGRGRLVRASERGAIRLVRSSAHRIENDANPREDRRLAAALWLDQFAIEIALTGAVEARARALGALGFTPLDALHLAFAEAAGARFFVTCDDRIAGLAARHRAELLTQVLSPLDLPRTTA